MAVAGHASVVKVSAGRASVAAGNVEIQRENNIVYATHEIVIGIYIAGCYRLLVDTRRSAKHRHGKDYVFARTYVYTNNISPGSR